jgi:hypothetical protein
VLPSHLLMTGPQLLWCAAGVALIYVLDLYYSVDVAWSHGGNARFLLQPVLLFSPFVFLDVNVESAPLGRNMQ